MYDADTCKIVLPVQNSFFKFTCRLSGIDAPEMKPKKDKVNRDTEIAWAKKARNELLRLVCSPTSKCAQLDDPKKEDIIKELEDNKKLVTVKCFEFDKYGRLLVELYNDCYGDSFNKILIDKNLAVSYDGGTKVNHWS
jgi:endonuclease YncB( thermonuclease family)